MSYVQSSSGTGTTTAAATLNGVAGGSTLVAFAWVGSNSAPTTHTVADGQGSYTAQGSAVTDVGNSIWVQTFVLQNANSGTHTATFTSDSGASVEIQLVECTAPTSSAIVGTAVGANQNSPGTTTDGLSSGNITIAQNVTLLGAASDTSNVSTSDEPTAGTGFTSRLAAADSVIGSWRIESKSVSATASATFTAVVGTSRFITIAIAVAEPAAQAFVPYMPYGLQPSLAM
jgi:hypothetical protein